MKTKYQGDCVKRKLALEDEILENIAGSLGQDFSPRNSLKKVVGGKKTPIDVRKLAPGLNRIEFDDGSVWIGNTMVREPSS